LPGKKSTAHRVWQKKFDVQFHQQNLSQICELKFAKSVRYFPNAICHIKLLTLLARKSWSKNVGEIDQR
jgi:hypothetical protein